MSPIDQQIMMTDCQQDLLILAFVMMNTAKDIIDQNLSPDQRKHLFKEFSK
jgi:hypothetical protein